MKNSILKELQEYYFSLKDVNGHWRESSISSIYEARTSKENLRTIKKILGIILDSDYISTETKIFISSKGISIKSINEFINEARANKVGRNGKVLRHVSYNNTCIKLQTDNNDLDVYLGNGLLREIAYNRITDKKHTNSMLVKFKERYGENYNYRDNLTLNIRQLPPKVNSYVNNEEFFDILGSLEAYLVQRMEIIENAINANSEFVQYFNYLLSKQAIDNDIVQKDRERLIRFLKNEDYIRGYTDDSYSEQTEEDFTNSDEDTHMIKPSNISVSEDQLTMDNYTVWNYDNPSDDV